MVVFAGIGDHLRIQPASAFSLEVDGPFAAGVPTDGTNVVLRAAEAMRPGAGAHVTLTKNLPHGGGVGGGSSDAAAALRALAGLWGMALPAPSALMDVGADLPVCLRAPAPAWMTGAGERLMRVPDLPPAWLVLAAPPRGAATAEVFAARAASGAPFEEPAGPPPAAMDVRDLATWATGAGNDLTEAAISVVPEIARVLAALRGAPGVLGAGMSGSGSTCWGLCADEADARGAAEALSAQPGWWVAPAPILRPGDALTV